MKSKKRELKRQLTNMDLERAEYAYVKCIVNRLSDGSKFTKRPVAANSPFYRVRSNPCKKPLEVKDLREPPKADVKGFQRCNGPGQPRFYSSNRILTAALEAKVSDGDTVYLSRWFTKRDIECATSVLSDVQGKVRHLMAEPDKKLIEYFESEFTRRIHKTFSGQYKLTAAISEVLTALNCSNTGDENQASAQRPLGIAFKSVVDLEGGINFSFHPSLIDEFFLLKDIIEAKVLRRNDKELDLEVLGYSDTVSDEKIDWATGCKPVPFLDFSNGGSVRYDGITWIRSSSD